MLHLKTVIASRFNSPQHKVLMVLYNTHVATDGKLNFIASGF